MTNNPEVEALIAEIEHRSRIYEWDYEDQAKFILSRESDLRARVKELEAGIRTILSDFNKQGSSQANYSDGEYTEDYTTRRKLLEGLL